MNQINFEKKLKEIDLKVTPARMAVLNLLEKTKQPIDVNTIINSVNKQGIKTDPATIFRIINHLTEKGLAIKVQFEDKKTRYELANREHHHHLVCDKCGDIIDISTKAVENLQKKIKEKYGFLVKRHSLEFFGLCSDCQN
jgi:Fur family ferric uptake transcriptional regulator